MLKRARNRVTSIVTMLTRFSNPVQTVRVFLGLNGNKPVVIRTRDGAYNFKLRGAFDTWALKETLLDDLYQRHGFAIKSDWTIVDIGAGFGDFSVVAARSAPNGRVLAFEPFPDSYQLLVDNIERNQVTNVIPSQMAVTGVEREVRLDFTNFEPLQVRSDDGAAPDRAEVVPSQTLESVIQAAGVTRVDLLKLDCEGCEYEVLMESSAAAIDRVDRIVMEYHEPISGKTHETLTGVLRKAGFCVNTTPNLIHPGEIGYLRASRNPEELS